MDRLIWALFIANVKIVTSRKKVICCFRKRYMCKLTNECLVPGRLNKVGPGFEPSTLQSTLSYRSRSRSSFVPVRPHTARSKSLKVKEQKRNSNTFIGYRRWQGHRQRLRTNKRHYFSQGSVAFLSNIILFSVLNAFLLPNEGFYFQLSFLI